jgi:hypothetical protein
MNTAREIAAALDRMLDDQDFWAVARHALANGQGDYSWKNQSIRYWEAVSALVGGQKRDGV